MYIYDTTNGFICQFLLGNNFEPFAVEYINHLRLHMLFRSSPELDVLLQKLQTQKRINKKVRIMGFEKYHQLLSFAEQEIEEEERGWFVEKIYMENPNLLLKNE